MSTETKLLPDSEIIQSMLTYGGSFVIALARTMRAADPLNMDRIKAAFPEIIEQYRKIAQNPDKDTLSDFANRLNALQIPSMLSPEGKRIAACLNDSLDAIATLIEEQAATL